ncbi:MAG: hypothetical protein JXA77_04475 [Bacteroidales bacterium]|nr:hypothetical protein [Bacteroidales bacterium]MBN2819810.1 hypothetical protein [Bacteroidales bacterium]
MKYKIFFPVIIVLSLISCNKDYSILDESNSTNNNSNKLLKFETKEEFNEAISEIVELSLNDLISYENLNGIRSFGRLSEEFYSTIDFEKFHSFEEIKSFVSCNSKYLQLNKDSNSEFELETKFYNRADRYMLNEDHMYQIGDSIFKVFDEGTIIADSKDINISELNNNDVEHYKNNSLCRFVPNQKNKKILFKTTTAGCGTARTWISENNKNRLKVEIEVDKFLNQNVTCHFLARPYKKTLGVWYWCSRTMKADVKLYFYYMDVANTTSSSTTYKWFNDDLTYYHNWIGTNKYEASKKIGLNGVCNGADCQPYFSSWDVWVDTYDVSPVDEDCN